VLDVLDHAALDQVLVGVDLTDRLDRRARHTRGLQVRASSARVRVLV
jgi:hypothetical protein